MWETEIVSRVIPESADVVRACVMLHRDDEKTDLDVVNWERIRELKTYLMKDSLTRKSLFTRMRMAISVKDYPLASELL